MDARKPAEKQVSGSTAGVQQASDESEPSLLLSNIVVPPPIVLPKGGGAIRGMGEKKLGL